MLQVLMTDLANGSGTKTGLPRPICGGMRLNTQEMPVCAAGRKNNTDVLLSYPLARGCVKLLQGELAAVELVGRQGDSEPSGIHMLLANGTSHAWVLVGDAPDGSGKALWLRGMPFSSQLFSYNAGIAIGLHLMQQAAAYPEFVNAVGKATASAGSGGQYAQAVALMADEMAHAVERMMDGSDPKGIGCVLMDREQLSDFDAVFDGGQDLKEAFTSPDSLSRFRGTSTSSTLSTSSDVPFTPSFVGDLPDKLVDCIRRGKHVLLTGPTATGKTRCVQEVTSYLGCPTSYIGGCEGLEDRDIIGSVSIENGNTRFVYGPLCESFVNGRKQAEKWRSEQESAKREGREPVPVPPAVLLVDEVNRLQSRFQNVFVTAMNVRPVTDDYFLLVPDTGEQLTCPVGFWVMIAARNIGSNYTSTNSMDLALERRFHKKIDLDYLQPEAEAELVCRRTGLPEDLTKVLIKTASDTRYQLSQLKAPLDTDTVLKWAEELAYIRSTGSDVSSQVLLDIARDIVFDICLERCERGGFDPAGEAVLVDNINENWQDSVRYAISRRTTSRLELGYCMTLTPVLRAGVVTEDAGLLEVRYKNELVPEPILLSVDIKNLGNKAINNPPIKVEATGTTYVIPMRIEDIPTGYEDMWELERDDADACVVKLNHINPGQVVKARFLLDEMPGTMPEFKCPMPDLTVRLLPSLDATHQIGKGVTISLADLVGCLLRK